MKLFIDRLIEQIEAKDSRICVGLDPHPDMLPRFLIEKYQAKYDDLTQATAAAVLEFNINLIDAIADITPAVKPQSAFYEILGLAGKKALYKTIEYAKAKGLIVILDAKRNDIGSTAAAYAGAYLGFEGSGKELAESADKEELFLKSELEVDCLTINPYFGLDGVEPFLRRKDRGAFALVKTSNQSGGEIQDLELKDGSKVYQQVGALVSEWSQQVKGEYGYTNLGAVVGATYPEELEELREKMSDIFFLIPGFGFQGGKAEDIVYGFDKEKRGAVVNSSRGINFAFRRSDEFTAEEYAEAAQTAAVKMRDEINELLNN